VVSDASSARVYSSIHFRHQSARKAISAGFPKRVFGLASESLIFDRYRYQIVSIGVPC